MKKAFEWLDTNGVAYTFHDYKTKGITRSKIEQWLKHTDLSSLINTKGTTFRQLSDSQKESIRNLDVALDLMIEKHSIIKRPIVETGHELLVGFNPEVWDLHV